MQIGENSIIEARILS